MVNENKEQENGMLIKRYEKEIQIKNETEGNRYKKVHNINNNYETVE